VGEVVAGLLAQCYPDLDALALAELPTLERIEGIGPSIATAIVDWFHNPRNQRVLEKLRRAGVWPRSTPHKQGETQGALQGQRFVITGTLPSLTRQQAKALIERHGGKVSGSVSGRTDYLLVGEAPGSKQQRARELGVKEIDEQGLLALIGN
jgi:DNA ligase (NAD+)